MWRMAGGMVAKTPWHGKAGWLARTTMMMVVLPMVEDDGGMPNHRPETARVR